jgi:hypothetical protein
MKGIILGFTAAIILAGCAASPRQQAIYDARERRWEMKTAARDAQSAIEDCSPANNPHVHSYTEAALCSNDKVLAIWQAVNYPYMDLLQLMAEARLVGGRQVDSGQLSADAYNAQIADLGKRVSMEAILRQLEKAAPASAAMSTTQARAIRKAALTRGLAAFDGMLRTQQAGDAPAPPPVEHVSSRL